MRKMALAAVFTALLVATGVAGAESPTLQRITESGTFRIGFVPDAPPMSFLDDQGNPVGYSLTLCRSVAAAIKRETGLEELEIEYVPLVLPEDRMRAVENGDVDIECGSSTVTLSRRERVDFSLMTFITGGAVLSLQEDPIPNFSGIVDKTIAVISGTTTHDWLHKFGELNDVGFTLRLIETHDKGMELLNDGKVDGYATDRTMIVGQVLRSEDASKYFITQDVFSFEPYALMLARGDTEFRLLVDRALASLYRTARIRRIYHDWFGRYGEPLSPIVEAVYEFQAVGE